MLKLQERILNVMRQDPEGRYSDGYIAQKLGVAPATIANEMTGLIRAGKVERVAPRNYQLVKCEAPNSGSSDDVFARCEQDLADALDITGARGGWSELIRATRELAQVAGSVPAARRVELARVLGFSVIPDAVPYTWDELLVAVRASRKATPPSAVPAMLLDTLGLPRDAAIATANDHAARLSDAAVLADELRRALAISPLASAAEAIEIAKETRTLAGELEVCRRSVKEIAESRARAEARLASVLRGVKALRAVLDAFEPEEE